MIDPADQADIELIKRQIEQQIGSYEQALAEYKAFMDDWREKNDPSRKRVKRFREASKSA